MTLPLLLLDPEQGIIDELQAWYLVRAEAEGMVFGLAVRLLLQRMYRDRDYLAKRKKQGHTTAYDYLTERHLKALAWLIRVALLYVPADVQAQPDPPPLPRPPRQRLPKGAPKPKGPSWNGRNRPGWAGPDLPPDNQVVNPYPNNQEPPEPPPPRARAGGFGGR
jgi:hypothetical protein